MMRFFSPMHAPQDDLAPADYTAVRSVREGRRRGQLQSIHPDRPQVDEYGIPENPYVQQPARSAAPRSRAARHQAEQAAQTAQTAQPPFQPSQPSQPSQSVQPVQQPAQGPQFQPPVSPEIPDWLRVAQQNRSTAYERPQAPRVQAAPRQPEAVSVYEEAGYPAYLVEEQRRLEREEAAVPVRRRHGAQYAQRPQYAPEPPPQPTGMSYPPPRTPVQAPPPPMERAYMHQPVPQPRPEEGWQVETDEETVSRELPAWVKKVPWLGIAAFAAVLAAVLLWIAGMNYDQKTQQVLDKRAEQEAQLIENHPLYYREIIGEKADKYNLSPAFVAAIMLNESSFRPEATNGSTGARGLMQLVEDTAEWVHGRLDLETPFRFDDMYQPEHNAEYGCWYLGYLSGLFHGDPVLVAAAFHAGQGEVRNWLNTAAYSPDGRTIAIDKIPFSDTRRYVGRVMNAYAAYLRIYYGK